MSIEDVVSAGSEATALSAPEVEELATEDPTSPEGYAGRAPDDARRVASGHVFHCADCGADLSKAEWMNFSDGIWRCGDCADGRTLLTEGRIAAARERAKERAQERMAQRRSLLSEVEALRNRCALLEEENARLGLQAREATSDRINELLAENKYLARRFEERDGAARLLEERVIEEQKKRVRAEDNSRALHEALEAEMERLDDAEDYSTAVRWLKVAAIVAISAVIAIGIMIWVTRDTGPAVEEMTTTVNTMPGSQELPQIDWEVMR